MIDIKFTIRTLNNTSTENLVGSTERSKREVSNGSNFELFRFLKIVALNNSVVLRSSSLGQLAILMECSFT